jgi:hypothetical protein
MDEQEKPNQSVDQKNIKKYKLRQLFSSAAEILAVLALIIGGVVGCIKIHEYYFTKRSIEYNFSRYKIEKVVVFSGELFNGSSYHAKGLTLKGKFSSKIIDLEVTTSDTIEKKEINNPNGSAEFSLNRLSKKSKCGFDIIANLECEIIQQVQVSWGDGGMLLLVPQESDEKVVKGIRLREKVSGLELSRNARRRWLENNRKNIR